MATISGTNGADTLNGTNLPDVINLLGGNDRSSAGFGDDLVRAGPGFDTIFGDDGNDDLRGEAEDDFLSGNVTGSIESITGGSGNDTLVGFFGVDRLTGGTGFDVFDFNSSAHSGIGGVGNRDVITDFSRGVDRIDLSTIDADAFIAGNQAFTFDGSGGGGADRGEVAFFVSTVTGNVVLTLDVNGGADEMQIELQGVTTVSAVDFIL